jgi:hypothetical protein
MSAGQSTNVPPFEPARRWFPVAPSIFDQVELSPTLPYEDERPPFFIAADFEDAPTVDRSPAPIARALSNCQSEFHRANRELTRELRRTDPRPRVINELRRDVFELRDERERLLDALMNHTLGWTHMSDDCAICDRSVAL